MFGHQHHGGEVQFHAAEALGKLDCGETQFGGFAEDVARDCMILMANGFEVRLDFIGEEFVRSAGDRKVLGREVLRSEDGAGLGVLRQECAAAQDRVRVSVGTIRSLLL